MKLRVNGKPIELPKPTALIDYLDSLEALVVVDEDGVWLADPADVVAVPIPEPLDPLTPAHSLEELPQGFAYS